MPDGADGERTVYAAGSASIPDPDSQRPPPSHPRAEMPPIPMPTSTPASDAPSKHNEAGISSFDDDTDWNW